MVDAEEAVVAVAAKEIEMPALGVGMGFRAPCKSEIFLQRKSIDFLEITLDHYLDATPEKQRELELLRENFTLIPHGLNLSLGSADGLNPDYLRKVAKLVNDLSPPWWSEHICFTQADGIEIGHLSPLPFTDEALDVLARNVSVVREHITSPLILENITYLHCLPGERMTEADFIAEASARTGCGLLLDVTNLYINATNHGYDVRDFLQRLPLDKIVQFHFVGGHQHHNGLLIDSHAQPTPDPVWNLMDEILAAAPVKGAILERDENFPPFTEILSELETARQIGRRYQRWA